MTPPKYNQASGKKRRTPLVILVWLRVLVIDQLECLMFAFTGQGCWGRWRVWVVQHNTAASSRPPWCYSCVFVALCALWGSVRVPPLIRTWSVPLSLSLTRLPTGSSGLPLVCPPSFMNSLNYCCDPFRKRHSDIMWHMTRDESHNAPGHCVQQAAVAARALTSDGIQSGIFLCRMS